MKQELEYYKQKDKERMQLQIIDALISYGYDFNCSNKIACKAHEIQPELIDPNTIHVLDMHQ